MNGPYETEDEAIEAANQHTGSPLWSVTTANERMLFDACADAGVTLGEYDSRILRWLAGLEPQTCAVIAGLIERAHAAGIGRLAPHIP